MSKRFVVVETPEGDGQVGLFALPSSWVVKDGWRNSSGSSVDADSTTIGNDLCFYPANFSGHAKLRKAMNGDEVQPAEEFTTPYRCKIKKYFATKAAVSPFEFCV